MTDEKLSNPGIFFQKIKGIKINYFCPFCGVHSYGKNKIKKCKHLTHIITSEDNYTYIRDDIKKFIDLQRNDIQIQLMNLMSQNDKYFCFQEDDYNDNEQLMIGYEYK